MCPGGPGFKTQNKQARLRFHSLRGSLVWWVISMY